jgi:hypothetical protein
MLLQVFLDTLGFAQQDGDVLVGRFEEVVDDVHRLLELLGELLVLLVAPGVAQADELAVQACHAIAQLGVEELEMVGEAPQLDGVDDRLGHDILGSVAEDWTAATIFVRGSESSKDKRARNLGPSRRTRKSKYESRKHDRRKDEKENAVCSLFFVFSSIVFS